MNEANPTFAIEDHHRRVRYLSTAGSGLVEQAPGTDGLGLRIQQKRKFDLLLVAERAQLIGIVVGDDPELGAGISDLLPESLQLPELRAAERSPGATEKDQQQRPFTAHRGQFVDLFIDRDQREGGRR